MIVALVGDAYKRIDTIGKKILLSGSGDGILRLWGLPDGRHLRTLEGHAHGIHCLAISPDGKILVSGGGDGTLRFWKSELPRLSILPLEQLTEQDRS